MDDVKIPEVGTPYSWEPAAFSGFCASVASFPGVASRIIGQIVYVNAEHRYFRAEGPCEGGVIRECFKF